MESALFFDSVNKLQILLFFSLLFLVCGTDELVGAKKKFLDVLSGEGEKEGESSDEEVFGGLFKVVSRKKEKLSREFKVILEIHLCSEKICFSKSTVVLVVHCGDRR